MVFSWGTGTGTGTSTGTGTGVTFEVLLGHGTSEGYERGGAASGVAESRLIRRSCCI